MTPTMSASAKARRARRCCGSSRRSRRRRRRRSRGSRSASARASAAGPRALLEGRRRRRSAVDLVAGRHAGCVRRRQAPADAVVGERAQRRLRRVHAGRDRPENVQVVRSKSLASCVGIRRVVVVVVRALVGLVFKCKMVWVSRRRRCRCMVRSICELDVRDSSQFLHVWLLAPFFTILSRDDFVFFERGWFAVV